MKPISVAVWPRISTRLPASTGIACGAARNFSNTPFMSVDIDGAIIATMIVPARIMNQLLTSREDGTWPFLRESSSFFCVGSSVFWDWSVLSSAMVQPFLSSDR